MSLGETQSSHNTNSGYSLSYYRNLSGCKLASHCIFFLFIYLVILILTCYLNINTKY